MKVGLEKARRVEDLSGEFKAMSAVHEQMIAGSRIRIRWAGWNGANARATWRKKIEFSYFHLHKSLCQKVFSNNDL